MEAPMNELVNDQMHKQNAKFRLDLMTWEGLFHVRL